MTYRIIAALATFGLFACAPAGPGESAGRNQAAQQDSDPLPAPPEAPAEENAWADYRAGGNEPFWSLTFADGRMTFDHFELADASAPLPEPQASMSGYRFESEADGQPFIVEIQQRYCADSMSGRPFPDTVIVTVHGASYRGCGGDTSALLTGRPWQVIRVGERPVAGSVGMTVRFADDGNISGYGGCNRYSGRYEVGGEGISTSDVVATQRGCLDPALTELEVHFIRTLVGLRSFAIDEDGRLTFIGENETEIVAQR